MPDLQDKLQQQPEQSTVLGLPVHLLPRHLDWLLERLRLAQGTHVVTLNAEMAIQAEQNPALAQIIHQAELVIPDGAGVVLYLQLWAGRRIARCPGIELAAALVQQAAEQPGSSILFYGSAPGVAQIAAERFQQQLPGLKIAGVQHGFLAAEDQPAFRQQLQQLQPSIILVGLGVPRQEFWIAENRHLCPHAIWIGVGGSFDIWAGTKDRAPEWLRDNHLEWTYRLYQEPWRWRRMLALPKFVWRSLLYQLTQP
ncbi:MAG: WecB/TagA/CpsF family glycosyltransferase [Pegethrix bostrychoides GSE-TBD4-15B]|jgi:N-acetylglucosaminyldiphosphoundecaprenol N-acetyl-beta-D-mannosaminyltransferase|uniref:WecB/TagA/CpsF family glycosyltransferase n=1 Tax=Pegethrix bostrychoides GSE-TBD4-15B TaxID=2839662 RepID=A0A951P9D3_9CYAN|nr:WecB/TagA/CpsF family glycosyltransferase [Pegethrix bostrychoides GSE-TBD4-15B]